MKLWMTSQFFPKDVRQIRIILVGPGCQDRIGGHLLKTKMPEPSQPESIIVAEPTPSLSHQSVVDVPFDLLFCVLQKVPKNVLSEVKASFDAGCRLGNHAVSLLDLLHSLEPFL